MGADAHVEVVPRPHWNLKSKFEKYVLEWVARHNLRLASTCVETVAAHTGSFWNENKK